MSVKVKVCGITRAADALLASDLGASAVGFVFWEKSPRSIDPESARAIVSVLPPDVAAIGVFVDPPTQYLADVVGHVGLAAVQLHGDETPEFCRNLPYRVMKSVSAGEAVEDERLIRWPESIMVLLDAADPIRKGGTGQTIDWGIAARVSARRRVFLAGGLTASNVGEAVKRVHPYAVDVSSGLEASPGVKAPDLMQGFFEAISAMGGAAEERGRSAMENQP